jgi:hypothetical protein
MPGVLTTASEVKCANSGKAQTSGQSKLKVSGSPVLTLPGIVGKTISGCTIVDSTPNATVQCKSVVSASGTASKLKVNGAPVALDTLTGLSQGTPPALTATANQQKLKAS